MKNSNIMIVVKKDFANTSQATTIWALAGEWHKTRSEILCQNYGYFSKIVRNFYAVVHIEGFIGLLFSSRIEVTMP
jgi:hypothetical protein